MPLFVFISGYFYRINAEEKILSFVLRKIKTLLLPYFLWRIVYAVITTLLLNANIIAYGKPFSLYNFFVDPWVHEDSFILILPAWFVPALFCVQVVFVLFRKLFRLFHFKNEIIFLFLFLMVGLIGVYAAQELWKTGTAYGVFSTPLRVAFFLAFYQLGFYYKNHLENRIPKNYLFYFGVIFFVQMCLLKCFSNLNFYVSGLSFPKFILLPYLSSFTGIAFWLGVSKILARALKENRIIRYIGQNTWAIMMHHPISFFIINCIIWGLSGPFHLIGFDLHAFQTNIWYTYSPGLSQFAIVYVVAGVALPLLAKYGVERLILWIDSKRTSRAEQQTPELTVKIC